MSASVQVQSNRAVAERRPARRTWRIFVQRCLAALFFAVVLGCSALLDALLSTSPSYEEKQEFEAQLRAEGVYGRERCRRIYDYHESWAKSLSECDGFIDSLEAFRAAKEKGNVEVKKGVVDDQKHKIEVKKP